MTSPRVREPLAALLRANARRLATTPLGRVLDTAPFRALRERALDVSAAEVLAILDACRDAGVECWLAGGWGVDALLGQQTRRHSDLDLCVDVVAGGEARAIDALAGLGYEVSPESGPSGRLFPERPVLRSPSGRVIDLLLVTTDDTASTANPLVVMDAVAIAEGVVDGRAVPCLSVELQLRARSGYVPTATDRRDVALLCEHAGVRPPGPYGRDAPSPPLPGVAGRLRRWARDLAGGGSVAALVMLVPDAHDALAAVGSPELEAIGPHLTVLYPFVLPRRLDPDRRAKLAALAAATPRFEFRLPALSSFPGVVYLAPDPVEPLTELLAKVADLFPEHPPYGGEYSEIVPHVTVAHDLEPADLAFTIDPLLPIECSTDGLVLMSRRRWGRWRERERYPFADP